MKTSSNICFLWTLSLLIGFSSLLNPLFASMRTEQDALRLANQYFASSSKIKRAPSAQPQVLKHSWTAKQPDGKPALYIFNRGEKNGFAIVSADDRSYEILAYSESGHLEEDAIPDNMRVWLEEYTRYLAWLAEQDIPLNQLTKNAQQTSYTPVSPICSTLWDQGNPYNLSCPEDDDKRCYTGCVATAAAQLMKAHQYPTNGTGSHAYWWHTLYGDSILLSANFGNTTYQWDQMLDTYGSSATNEQKQAVATLMYHCGVACNMSYGPSSSSANSRRMMYGLTRYFDYDKSIRALPKDYMGEEAVLDAISRDLLLGHPVFFSAKTFNNEGHAFICDGIDADGMLHINWGWSGTSDGYFRLSAFNPQTQGSGGSVYNRPYVLRVIAFSNIRPNQNGDYVYTIGARSIAPFRTRYGRDDVIVFQQDTLTNLSICSWEGSPVMEVYRDGTLYTSYIDSNTQLSLDPEWFYRSRYLTAPSFASLEEGQYELQFAYTTSTDNNQLIPVYVNGIGEYRCQMTVTSDSIFFTLPDKQWEDITPPNPNDFVFTQLRGYYYPTKSDIFSSAWKLQLATQSFYSSTASNEMCIVFNAKGFYPDAMVGTFMEDPVTKEGFAVATMYLGNSNNYIRIDMDSCEYTLVYHSNTRTYRFHYHLQKNGNHYVGQADIPAADVRACYGEQYDTHARHETITLDNNLYTTLTTTQATNIILSKGEGGQSYIPYVVEGTISQLLNTPEQMLTYHNCRLYISDSVTPLYAYNTRWLNNSDYTTGYEIKLGGEAIIVGRLLNYQGTPEIEKGYFCHYSVPESLENLYDDPNTNQDSFSPDTCTKELIHGILFIRKGSKRYTIIGNEVR